MNRKIVTIVLAIVLIAGFFLPLSGSSSSSAFDIVKGPSYGSGVEALLMKYLWALVPISGLMLLVGALNNGNYFLGRGLWTWLPLLALLYFIVKPAIDGAKIGNLVKDFGIGYWVMLGGSLILALYNPRS